MQKMEGDMHEDDEVDVKEIYKQQYAHFGRMNDVLYKMPPIFSTILGGLWYFAVSSLTTDPSISIGVFGFAAVASLCFIVTLRRFRLAFNEYLDNINRFDRSYKVSIKSSRWPSAITAMTFLIGTAFIVSLAGTIYAVTKY